MTRNDGRYGSRAELTGCRDAPHVAPLYSHLCRRLELPGVVGTVGVKVLVDSGPGVTGISNIHYQLWRQWPEVELMRPCTGDVEASGRPVRLTTAGIGALLPTADQHHRETLLRRLAVATLSLDVTTFSRGPALALFPRLLLRVFTHTCRPDFHRVGVS